MTPFLFFFPPKKPARLVSVAAFLAMIVCGQEMNETEPIRDSIYIGPCTWVIDRKCPDKDVKFWLFTQSNPDERQFVHVEDTWEKSNLSSSFYNPMFPVKIIIHGYNSDMELTPLIDMKQEYLQRGNYNLFYVDWSILGPGPCEFNEVFQMVNYYLIFFTF